MSHITHIHALGVSGDLECALKITCFLADVGGVVFGGVVVGTVGGVVVAVLGGSQRGEMGRKWRTKRRTDKIMHCITYSLRGRSFAVLFINTCAQVYLMYKHA